jgi:L-lactate dehydrogenase complex protein LldF
LLLKHREVIVEKEGRAPLAEKLAMKMFSMGASSAAMYRVGSKLAPSAMSPFTSGDRVSKGVGPLKNWTEIREFPAPSKERFRDWFKNRTQGGED